MMDENGDEDDPRIAYAVYRERAMGRPTQLLKCDRGLTSYDLGKYCCQESSQSSPFVRGCVWTDEMPSVEDIGLKCLYMWENRPIVLCNTYVNRTGNAEGGMAEGLAVEALLDGPARRLGEVIMSNPAQQERMRNSMMYGAPPSRSLTEFNEYAKRMGQLIRGSSQANPYGVTGRKGGRCSIQLFHPFVTDPWRRFLQYWSRQAYGRDCKMEDNSEKIAKEFELEYCREMDANEESAERMLAFVRYMDPDYVQRKMNRMQTARMPGGGLYPIDLVSRGGAYGGRRLCARPYPTV